MESLMIRRPFVRLVPVCLNTIRLGTVSLAPVSVSAWFVLAISAMALTMSTSAADAAAEAVLPRASVAVTA